ncbi:pyridoxamine 5'-phosphate oxidase family protein [Nocardioides donggukensis]|uniref:Pyridoxamine 5'-phosphate oxidase family protein n=1 Tax=Nocardioides donggukensis TaxID=2774019 RepID=A0A927PYV4_9ACTN|nr:pyridoxamine 5'-phosphate oxidase family protein [Nocardioides donggukensis]MBD8869053.1 pyridoxamine 5'-phosphate oxidase family protein [Nocardioides donggukensis]
MGGLNRHPEYGVADRAALDALLDSQWHGVLSTVVEGGPWAVPMLYARDGDRLVLHGSTGAGALRLVAAGAPAVLSVVAVDALAVAPTTFESSLNYRSATVRGALTPLPDAEREAALDLFSDTVLPGRVAEVRRSSRKELAATLAMTLPIGDDWLLKVTDGWPATPAEADADPGVWSGLVPVRTVLDAPRAAPWAEGLPVPPSVRRLTGG